MERLDPLKVAVVLVIVCSSCIGSPQVQYIYPQYQGTGGLRNTRTRSVIELQPSFGSYRGQGTVTYTTANGPSVPGDSLESLMSSAIQEATAFVEHSERASNVSTRFGVQAYTARGHGMGGHNYCKFSYNTEKIGRLSNIHIKAYEIMTKRLRVSKSQAINTLRQRLPEFCTRQLSPKACDPSNRFRTIDGTCNNLQNPYWGSAYEPVLRLVPAVYEDGWNEPRGAGKNLKGTRLPNPRVVSLSVHRDFINPDNLMTNMVPQVGQFLDHDMTLTPEADRKCCSTESNHVECWNIQVPKDDYFYSKLRTPQTCLDFTRSTAYCFPHNNQGVREQMNMITAFIDASSVYGSEESRSRLLRSFAGGKLKVNSQNRFFLPTVEEVQRATGEHFEFMGTFLAGDERVNEMPALTVMHTLLFREHNRLADEIQRLRPYWDDERVFQEARRLVVAQWQNIIYGEYLPIILGQETMTRYNLNFDDVNLYTTYNAAVNPTIFHAFADAAYRFGHSLINGLIRMMRGFKDVDQYQIRNGFFNHEFIAANGGEGYDLILNGLIQQNSQTYDTFVTEDVTNFLLKEPEHDFGSDLIARNLQRGRDHGLPSYNSYRQVCGFSALTNSWANRPNNIADNVWRVLSSLYQTPADIDLFTGGLSEEPVRGGVTGSTFNCLKAIQFSRVKYGDRFFFTHSGQSGSMTPDQIREIRRSNLGNIICLNSKSEMTTKNVFKIPSQVNPMVYCNDPTRNYLNVEMFLYNKA